MDAGDWIALGGTIFALVLHSIGVAMFLARLAAKVESNTKAIDLLISTKVSTEQGSGFQAQINRLEKGSGEMDVSLSSLRQEFESRLLAQRDITHKLNESWSAAASSLSAAIARLEATVQSLGGQIQHLYDAERARSIAPPVIQQSQPDLMAMLSLAVQAAPVIEKLITRQRAAA